MVTSVVPLTLLAAAGLLAIAVGLWTGGHIVVRTLGTLLALALLALGLLYAAGVVR